MAINLHHSLSVTLRNLQSVYDNLNLWIMYVDILNKDNNIIHLQYLDFFGQHYQHDQKCMTTLTICAFVAYAQSLWSNYITITSCTWGSGVVTGTERVRKSSLVSIHEILIAPSYTSQIVFKLTHFHMLLGLFLYTPSVVFTPTSFLNVTILMIRCIIWEYNMNNKFTNKYVKLNQNTMYVIQCH